MYVCGYISLSACVFAHVHVNRVNIEIQDLKCALNLKLNNSSTVTNIKFKFMIFFQVHKFCIP